MKKSLAVYSTKPTQPPMDINTKFTLGDKITDEQREFYHQYGFVQFKGAFSMEVIEKMRASITEAATQVTKERKTAINGVPVKYGYDSEGKLVPQRTPFMNLLSPYVNEIVRSPKLGVLLEFIPGSRFGLEERDGVVINHYVNAKKSKFKKLGWHTDAIRDIFYMERVRPMLNVGIHIFPSSKTHGGLRLIPGSHNQGLLGLLFGKKYIIDNKADPREIAVETEVGDLTVHDGRLWHRAESPSVKMQHSRKSLYFPILSGPYKPKNEFSKAPFYLRFMSNVVPPETTT